MRYNRTNGEPCCAHKYLTEDVLRGKWKFEGHYTSDCWAIRDFHEHHMVTSTPRQSAAMALNAGCDLNCGNTYLHMMGAYQDGLVTEEKINRIRSKTADNYDTCSVCLTEVNMIRYRIVW